MDKLWSAISESGLSEVTNCTQQMGSADSSLLRVVVTQGWLQLSKGTLQGAWSAWRAWARFTESRDESLQHTQVKVMLFVALRKKRGPTSAKGILNGLRWVSRNFQINFFCGAMMMGNLARLPPSHRPKRAVPVNPAGVCRFAEDITSECSFTRCVPH